jgi:hypothetical protein
MFKASLSFFTIKRLMEVGSVIGMVLLVNWGISQPDSLSGLFAPMGRQAALASMGVSVLEAKPPSPHQEIGVGRNPGILVPQNLIKEGGCKITEHGNGVYGFTSCEGAVFRESLRTFIGRNPGHGIVTFAPTASRGDYTVIFNGKQ